MLPEDIIRTLVIKKINMSFEESDFIVNLDDCKNYDCEHYACGGCMFPAGCIYYDDETNEKEWNNYLNESC
jgi:hypothetical protein